MKLLRYSKHSPWPSVPMLIQLLVHTNRQAMLGL
jgi:hypothetical protein